MKLVTVAEMQAIERESNERGWTYEQMMERAGNGLAEMVESFYGVEDERLAVGLVGAGNNGGDTLVALTRLAQDGWKIRAYLVRKRPAGDTLQRHMAAAGGEVVIAEDDAEFKTLDDWLENATVLLDGVLGTGSAREVTPSEGTHTITLDVSGGAASATTTVVVEVPPPLPERFFIYLPLVLR